MKNFDLRFLFSSYNDEGYDLHQLRIKPDSRAHKALDLAVLKDLKNLKYYTEEYTNEDSGAKEFSVYLLNIHLSNDPTNVKQFENFMNCLYTMEQLSLILEPMHCLDLGAVDQDSNKTMFSATEEFLTRFKEPNYLNEWLDDVDDSMYEIDNLLAGSWNLEGMADKAREEILNFGIEIEYIKPNSTTKTMDAINDGSYLKLLLENEKSS